MRDHLGQLLLGHAVVQRALQMAAQLLRPIGGDQRRADDQAAVALGKLRALPDVAEQHLLGQVDHLGNRAANAVARFVEGAWAMVSSWLNVGALLHTMPVCESNRAGERGEIV